MKASLAGAWQTRPGPFQGRPVPTLASPTPRITFREINGQQEQRSRTTRGHVNPPQTQPPVVFWVRCWKSPGGLPFRGRVHIPVPRPGYIQGFSCPRGPPDVPLPWWVRRALAGSAHGPPAPLAAARRLPRPQWAQRHRRGAPPPKRTVFPAGRLRGAFCVVFVLRRMSLWRQSKHVSTGMQG